MFSSVSSGVKKILIMSHDRWVIRPLQNSAGRTQNICAVIEWAVKDRPCVCKVSCWNGFSPQNLLQLDTFLSAFFPSNASSKGGGGR